MSYMFNKGKNENYKESSLRTITISNSMDKTHG